ncbi:serine/threonine-protein kinase [Alkalinema sp. FACHB-956]|uniref:serine/threonine-protein kinase n=1 Tax=Alkalinema sp. FACHB-956 TaxID=2692768 RepID=UPI0016821DA7|nr:serine/threonine-protein kinase [Alkalinema sp. FACHB-956]MBD2326010.1 protein kinase [Alkalinema sp. FACHB-956]
MPLILSDGRYVPIESLGDGGFGRVFLAYDLKFPQNDGTYARRAIKQFRSDRGLFPGQIQQALKAFESEADVLDKLRHTQIPRVYEPFQVQSGDHSYAYFVQEYVPGDNLQKILDNSSGTVWPETAVKEMLRQMLEILDYLQTRSSPVIHRDIKPSNIIQTTDGKYHLIDFGAVHQVMADTISTISGQTTQPFCTPEYAAPEQLQGQIGLTTDLYALAKTAICLLTGNPNGALPHHTSWQFKRLLLQMRDPDPVKRPASASVALTQLNQQRPPGRLLGYGLLGGCTIAGLITYGLPQFNRPKIPQRDWTVSLSTISDISFPPPVETTYFYGGSTTAEPLAAEINDRIQRNNLKLILKRKPPSQGYEYSADGIDRLIQGELDFALSSKGIQAKQANNARARQVKLAKIAVATTSSAVVVHPELPIGGITSKQLELIEARKILNWQEVGGPDLPIRMYATDAQYIKNPSGGEPQAGVDFTKVKNFEEAFQRIQDDRGGMMIAPTSVVVRSIVGCSLKALKLGFDAGSLLHPYQQERILSSADCRANKRNQVNLKIIEASSYKLLSTISVIVLQDAGIKQWIGEYYAAVLTTKEAKRIMAELGYVPIPSVNPEVQN